MKDFRPFIKNSIYGVSEDGYIKNLKTGKILKNSLASNGYYVVNICIEGKSAPYLVHRMVAETYLDAVENKTFVNHIDGDKLNNHRTNLEWCTNQENMNHAWQNGLMVKGENSPSTELLDADVREICKLLAEGKSTGYIQKHLAHHNLSRYKLLNIRARRCWTHISKDYEWPYYKSRRNSNARN